MTDKEKLVERMATVEREVDQLKQELVGVRTVDTRQAADMLGMSLRWVQLHAEAKLEGEIHKGAMRIPVSAILRYLEER